MFSHKLSRSLLLLLSLVCLNANAQEIDSATDGNAEDWVPEPSVPVQSDNAAYLKGSAAETLSDGQWIWGLVTESVLSNGATSVKADVSVPSTYYVGGVGYVAVSKDSGATWREAVNFQHTGSGLDDEDAEESAEIPDSERSKMAERRREAIRQEIVDKFGSEDYADSILDNIADVDLLEANDISDIDELEVLDLDMDPNLNHIRLKEFNSPGEEGFLSDYDRYIERYISLVSRGAEPEAAVLSAADSGAVWQIISTVAATFAVSSETVFMTTDKGESWQNFIPCTEERACLSLDMSEDGRIVVVGTTKGLMLTQDGGLNWMTVTDGLDGGIFDVSILNNGQKLLALSTGHLYESLDQGSNWFEVVTPLNGNEIIVDIAVGSSDRMLALTTENLYLVESGNWTEISYRPFGEETLREVVSKDPSLSRFIVRTDAHVFEFDKGWKSQNKALFSTDLGSFDFLSDNISLGFMASSSGVWIAQDISILENTPEYQYLKDKWSSEPSDDMVIYQALEAHYLGSTLESRWGMRSCFAWLLPRVDFDYIFRQERQDYRKTVVNGRSGLEESDVWSSRRQTRHEWQIMAHWDIQIDKANTESIARESTLAGLRDDRVALIKKVNSELAKRHALEITLVLDLPKLPDNARNAEKKSLVKKQLKARLGLEEAESHLNYLTGGYYLPAIHGNRQP